MVAQDHIQMCSKSMQEERLNNISREPVPVFNHSHHKEMFPDVQKEPPEFQFMSTALCLVFSTTWKLPGSILFTPSLFIYLLWWGPPETSVGWQVPVVSAFPHKRVTAVLPSSSWPFTGLSTIVPGLLWTVEPRTGHRISVVVTPVLSSWEGPFPWTCSPGCL